MVRALLEVSRTAMVKGFVQPGFKKTVCTLVLDEEHMYNAVPKESFIQEQSHEKRHSSRSAHRHF